jgi:hypothetical protein
VSGERSSYLRIAKRPLTHQEAEWVSEIVASNPRWAAVEFKELPQVVAECSCGCRSVVIDATSHPQNPKLVGHQGLVGGNYNQCKTRRRKDEVITVLLHLAEGSLSLLEVIWYNFPEPIPSTWTELSCHGYIDD